MRRDIARHHDMRAATGGVVPYFAMLRHRILAIKNIGRVIFYRWTIHVRSLGNCITTIGEFGMIAFAAERTGQPHQ